MDKLNLILLVLAGGLAAGFILSAVYHKITFAKRLKDAENKAQKLLQEAQRDAEAIKKRWKPDSASILIELKEVLAATEVFESNIFPSLTIVIITGNDNPKFNTLIFAAINSSKGKPEGPSSWTAFLKE